MTTLELIEDEGIDYWDDWWDHPPDDYDSDRVELWGGGADNDCYDYGD